MELTERDLFPFGALLRNFRIRRRLTQQQLAEAIGVHRNAIGRWERGDFLPAQKAMVLELARYLHLDEQESRQLLEASLTALTPYWQVPFLRNPYFTGREDILEVLHMHLGGGQAIALTHSSTLHGLGGIGKTQTALEYAYRHALDYSALFWIGAESEEQIVSSLLHIAESLQLPGRDDRDPQRVTAAVQRWLSTHDQWLLIWDNVDDLTLLDRFLPPTRSGAMLFTTRRQAMGPRAQSLDLKPMEHEEGRLFLLRRAKFLALEATREQIQQFVCSFPAEYEAAGELVTHLGGLPLALDQAGAYIEETGCSLTSYLRRYVQQRSSLLGRRGSASEVSHPHSVTATFGLTYEQIEREQPAAAQVLRVCAVLHSDAIPEELFLDGVHHLGPEVEWLARDPIQFDQALAALRNLSLIQRHPGTQLLSMHRLLQEVLCEWIGEQEQLLWRRRAIAVLNSLFPEVTYEAWKQCERLLPHVLACALASSTSVEGQELVTVLRKAADYLRERAEYTQAEACYQQALHIGEQALGAEHPNLAAAYCGLAILYTEQGKYELAEPLYQRALLMQERVFGSEHLEVAHLLFRLANLSYRQGKYEQAEVWYQQALHMQERIGGLNHPLVAQSLHGLAYLYSWQGKYEQAEPLYRRALHIREQVLGPTHPDLGTSLNGLANLYQAQGKDELAEPLLQRALCIWKETFGPEHPQVAAPLFSLALTYVHQGKEKLAEPLYQQALQIWEQSFGPEHPNVASPLNELANLYMNQTKLAQAERAGLRALQIWERALGTEHPNVGYALDTLATVYVKQGKDEQAEPLYQRAIQVWEQAFGSDYPQIPATRDALASLVRVREKDKGEADREEAAASLQQERSAESTSFPSDTSVTPFPSEHDHMQDFLMTCCELHPLAWCRVSDLWQAYEHWSATEKQCIPLSRRTFSAQLIAHGCRAGRTNRARIWYGICLANKKL